jgi:outer membrane protein assembly factor BamB
MAHIKLAGNKYALAKHRSQDVYSTGKRVTQGIPSDDFEIRMDDWSAGMGVDYYYAQNVLATVRGRLMPYSTPTYAGGATASDSRFFWEAAEAGGNWYLYMIDNVNVIHKVDITADPPAWKESYTRGVAPLNLPGPPAVDGNTQLRRPAFLTTVLDSNGRWFIPCNDENMIIRQTTVGLFPAADTFALILTVIEGASDFVVLPSGKVARLVADRGAAGLNPRAQVSLLAAGADVETDVNWGGEHDVGVQPVIAFSLLAFDELLVVAKQDNWYAAVEQEDGTLRWRELLPDANYMEEGTWAAPRHRFGLSWHAKMMLPTPDNFWRQNLTGALPVGLDALPNNFGDEPNLTDQPRFGEVPSAAHGGAWIYFPYNLDGGGFYVMAGRERTPYERGETEMVYHPIYYAATGACDGVYIQKNGVGGPRLWFSGGDATTRLVWIDIGKDRAPFAPGAAYGKASSDGVIIGLEHRFDSLVLLREQEVEIEEGVAELTWQPQVSRDGAALANVGTALAATGKAYWTARTSDTCRRARFALKWIASAGYTALANVSRVRKWIIRGTYLPSVADNVACTVDLSKTAAERGTSSQAIRDELDALVKSGVKALVDLHGNSYEVVIDDAQEGPAPHVAELEGKHVVGLQMRVVEYS